MLSHHSNSLIELKEIGFSAHKKVILEEISFSLEREEIVTVMGPNGAGKTTLLRIAIGLLAPTTGDVRKAEKLTVGYMPQKFHLPPGLPLSAKRFLSFARDNLSKTEMMNALEKTGAAHVFNSEMKTLSGGEFQRVMLARALLRQPNLLILDEPLQGVDVQGQVDLFELLVQIRDTYHCGILMVSHDLHLVLAATDKVLCLNKHICCSGTPAAVSSDPEYHRMYGQLAMYQHNRQHQHNHQGESSHD